MTSEERKKYFANLFRDCFDGIDTTREPFVLEPHLEKEPKPVPPDYIAGILLDEKVCEIYRPGIEKDTPVRMPYCNPAALYLPPHSLIQLIAPHWEGTRLVAENLLYFTPADGYTRMGQYGELSRIWPWMAPDPVFLRKRGVRGWPCIGPFCSPRGPLPPEPEEVHASAESGPAGPARADQDEKEEDRLLKKYPALGPFFHLLRDNASGEAREPAGIPDLPAGMSRQELKQLYRQHRDLYSSEVQTELDSLLNGPDTGAGSASSAERLPRRARQLLRYAYRRSSQYTPIPEEPLQTGLEQALPGQEDVISRVMTAVRVANASRKPLTLLLLDEEEVTAREVIRCLCCAVPGAARLDGSLGDLNLAGLDSGYDGATLGQTIRRMDGPLLCIEKLEAVYWSAETNKDSAARSFNTLFGNRTFSDRFLGVTVEYNGHIVAQAATLDLKYRSQFSRIVEIHAGTREERIRRLQEKAKGTEPAFVLEKDTAEKLLQQYAPGSMGRALEFLELLRIFAQKQDRPVGPDDLTAALGKPSLTRDEQLVADLETCAGSLPEETVREAFHQARVLLGTHTGNEKKELARRILRTLADYQQASRGVDPPSRQQLRRGLDAELLGLKEEKDLVIQTLYAHNRRILFFVGAPGTGKTALARALARASGQALVRIDMTALRTEQLTGLAPFMGQGGQESILVRRIARAGRPAVILLDEIDKARPAVVECLLELFENQRLFSDALVGRVDLSPHLILLSGNSRNISRPLLDRCRVITMRPYSPAEKEMLLRQKWQQALEAEGLPFRPLGEELVRGVVRRCDTGGARDIENLAECLVRLVSAGKPLPGSGEELDRLTGSHLPALPVIRAAGTVYCLGALANGGGVVSPLLVRENPVPGAPRLQLLGMRGSTLQESARMAMTWVSCQLQEALPPVIMAMDSSEKDGPSGGVAMALACYSLRTGCVLEGVAATGELMLDGTVLPVGGIPSKLIGAVRCAPTVHTLFLPAANRTDVPPRLLREVEQAGIRLHFVETVQQAIQALKEKNKE